MATETKTKKAKKDEQPAGTPSEQLLARVSKMKNLSMIKTADEAMDMSVTCVPTGFLALDRVLRPASGGWPRGKHAEVYSKREQSGKTSLMVQCAAAFQRAGLTTALADIEHASTRGFYHSLGLVTDITHPTLCAPLMIGEDDQDYSAEQYLQTGIDVSKIVDFVGYDSVAGLETAANLAKEMTEAPGMGGISQPLGRAVRTNLHPKAFIMWLNQSRVAVGAYNPMGGPVYCQPGGKAVGFFATLRLELSNIDKLKENKDADPVGFIVQVFAAKNRLGPPYRNCKMKYIFGEGFSWLWDYMDMGIKLGAIEKSGSWYEFDGQRMQGYMPMYHLIKGSPELSAQLRHVVDGDAAAEAEIVAQNVDQPLQFDPAKLEE